MMKLYARSWLKKGPLKEDKVEVTSNDVPNVKISSPDIFEGCVEFVRAEYCVFNEAGQVRSVIDIDTDKHQVIAYVKGASELEDGWIILNKDSCRSPWWKFWA